MITYRAILLLGVFITLRETSAQSINDAFPDFKGEFAIIHYDVSFQVRFPLEIGGKESLPDVEGWIEQLKSLPNSDGTLRVSIFRREDVVRFIRMSYTGKYAQERIYLISENSIELVMPRVDGVEGLWSNQLGISRWSWYFDTDRELLETKYFRWNPALESKKLVYRWTLVKQDTNQKIPNKAADSAATRVTGSRELP